MFLFSSTGLVFLILYLGSYSHPSSANEEIDDNEWLCADENCEGPIARAIVDKPYNFPDDRRKIVVKKEEEILILKKPSDPKKTLVFVKSLASGLQGLLGTKFFRETKVLVKQQDLIKLKPEIDPSTSTTVIDGTTILNAYDAVLVPSRSSDVQASHTVMQSTMPPSVSSNKSDTGSDDSREQTPVNDPSSTASIGQSGSHTAPSESDNLNINSTPASVVVAVNQTVSQHISQKPDINAPTTELPSPLDSSINQSRGPDVMKPEERAEQSNDEDEKVDNSEESSGLFNKVLQFVSSRSGNDQDEKEGNKETVHGGGQNPSTDSDYISSTVADVTSTSVASDRGELDDPERMQKTKSETDSASVENQSKTLTDQTLDLDGANNQTRDNPPSNTSSISASERVQKDHNASGNVEDVTESNESDVASDASSQSDSQREMPNKLSSPTNVSVKPQDLEAATEKNSTQKEEASPQDSGPSESFDKDQVEEVAIESGSKMSSTAGLVADSRRHDSTPSQDSKQNSRLEGSSQKPSVEEQPGKSATMEEFIKNVSVGYNTSLPAEDTSKEVTSTVTSSTIQDLKQNRVRYLNDQNQLGAGVFANEKVPSNDSVESTTTSRVEDTPNEDFTKSKPSPNLDSAEAENPKSGDLKAPLIGELGGSIPVNEQPPSNDSVESTRTSRVDDTPNEDFTKSKPSPNLDSAEAENPKSGDLKAPLIGELGGSITVNEQPPSNDSVESTTTSRVEDTTNGHFTKSKPQETPTFSDQMALSDGNVTWSDPANEKPVTNNSVESILPPPVDLSIENVQEEVASVATADVHLPRDEFPAANDLAVEGNERSSEGDVKAERSTEQATQPWLDENQIHPGPDEHESWYSGIFSGLQDMFSGSSPELQDVPPTDSYSRYIPETTSAENEDKCSTESCSSDHKNESGAEGIFSDYIDILPPQSTVFMIIAAIAVLFFSLGHYYLENLRRDVELVSKYNDLAGRLFIEQKEKEMLAEQLATANESMTQISFDTSKYDEEIGELKTLVQKFKEEKAALEEREKETNRKYVMVDKNYNELRKILSQNKQKGERSALIVDIKNLKDSITANNIEIASLKEQLTEKKEEVKSLNAKIMEYLEMNKKLEMNVENAISEGHETAQKYQDTISKLEKTIEENLTARVKLEEECMSLKKDKESLAIEKELAESSLQKFQKLTPSKSLSEWLDAKNVRVAHLAAETKVKELSQENEDLRREKNQLEEIRSMLVTDLDQLNEKYEKAEKDKIEALTRLQVLSDYFKEKETQLQEELGSKEALWLQKQSDDRTIYEQMRALREENTSFKNQNETLKREILEQEASFKKLITSAEEKAHENWVALRHNERRLKEAQMESSQLRARLSAMGASGDGVDVSNKVGEVNGDVPPYGSATSPPFMLYPEFVPPPPLLTSAPSRPPPLGRISSPPLGDFTPPPPLVPYDMFLPPSPPPPVPHVLHKPQPLDGSRRTQKDSQSSNHSSESMPEKPRRSKR